MRILRLLFIALFGVWVGAAGCVEALPGRNSDLCDEEFEPTLICVALCDKSVRQCEFFSTPTVEACVQVCECQLAGGRAISPGCEDALASEFACGAALNCSDLMDLITKFPPSDFPCFAEVGEVDAQCGTT